ncbi:DUF1778 domain-containing protein [Actinomadura sp. SCN-SB]|uniref:type II toxin -antitoxin system TacA 1-like antitoxin n=1 Tax=Actinomadura sp. SCN-SB TaxID=3373092 RepID=UPI0037534E7B
MSESVQQDLPIAAPNDRIEVPVSGNQGLAIRKAAELVGWTVEQYVLSAALDRAERDLYEHATLRRETRGRLTGETDSPKERPAKGPPLIEPFVAAVTALG